MRPYEAMVVLRPNLEQDALDAVINRLTDVITDQGGQITHVDPWGKRRLAYEIDGHTEGYYVVIKFQGQPGITTELERIMRITDAVMRFLVVGRIPRPCRSRDPGAEVREGRGKAGRGAIGSDEAQAAAERRQRRKRAPKRKRQPKPALRRSRSQRRRRKEAKASAEAGDDADEAAGKQES